MKLKAKLISTIAAFAMVLCLTIVGVWATATVTVSVTGTVSYTATDVDATVTGTITGITESGKNFEKTFNAASTENSGAWNLSGITFVKNQDVVITLNVKNNSTERPLQATLANNGEDTGTNTTAALGETKTSTIAARDNASFTFTIKVTDWNKAASYGINLMLTLNNQAA
jgi:hypothetical protein